MAVRVVHFSQIPAEPVAEAEGVTIRWLIARAHGAPHFAMRLFEVPPGGASPHHRHWWEHEVFILDGEGLVSTEEGDFPLRPGVAVLVPGEALHQFRNSGSGPLRFLCLVPHPELQGWAGRGEAVEAMSDLEGPFRALLRLPPSEPQELARRPVAHLERAGRRPPVPSAAAVLLFDGGSRGNPGPGYGSFLVTLPDGSRRRGQASFRGSVTNNQAEYRALIAGLEFLHRLLGGRVGQLHLEVRGDSRLVVEQVEGRWKATNPELRALRDRARELLAPFASWSLGHIPREEVVRDLGH